MQARDIWISPFVSPDGLATELSVDTYKTTGFFPI